MVFLDSDYSSEGMSDNDMYAPVERRHKGSARDDRRKSSDSPTSSMTTVESSVSREEFNAMKQALRKAHRDTRRLEGVNGELKNQVVSLEKGIVERKQMRYGRNNVKRDGWGRRDHNNLQSANKICKEKLFPKFKFLPVPDWKKFTPTEKGTLCYQIWKVVTVPRGADAEIYWDNRMIPIVNKKYVEMRSNLNSAMRRRWQREIYVLVNVCFAPILF